MLMRTDDGGADRDVPVDLPGRVCLGLDLLAQAFPGSRRRDHREVIDAIARKLRTGSRWVHLPEKYGNWRGLATG